MFGCLPKGSGTPTRAEGPCLHQAATRNLLAGELDIGRNSSLPRLADASISSFLSGSTLKATIIKCPKHSNIRYHGLCILDFKRLSYMLCRLLQGTNISYARLSR